MLTTVASIPASPEPSTVAATIHLPEVSERRSVRSAVACIYLSLSREHAAGGVEVFMREEPPSGGVGGRSASDPPEAQVRHTRSRRHQTCSDEERASNA